MNYLLGAILIASPWIFGLANISSAALFIPIYIGWLQLIMAVFVDNETGFIKIFPMQTHMVLDVAMGFFLLVSPWLYTFASKDPSNPTAFLSPLILGGLLMFMGIFTKRSPFLGKLHKSLPQGGEMTSTASSDGRLSI